MKRRTLQLAALTLTLGLIGCGKKEGGNGDGNGDGGGGDKPPAPAAADFSTPMSAVETFIKAGTAKDAETLSKCIAADAAGELAGLREKTASDEDLAELAEFLKGGMVTTAEAEEGKATVKVKLSSREESMSLTETDDGWKIVDF